MIDKVVFKHSLTEDTVDRELAYWATRSPEERWNTEVTRFQEADFQTL